MRRGTERCRTRAAKWDDLVYSRVLTDEIFRAVRFRQTINLSSLTSIFKITPPELPIALAASSVIRPHH